MRIHAVVKAHTVFPNGPIPRQYAEEHPFAVVSAESVVTFREEKKDRALLASSNVGPKPSHAKL